MSYAPRAHTPAVRVSHKRKGLSVISTVTKQGEVSWMVCEKAMNADVPIDFLKRVAKDTDRKVFLILDNPKVNHARPLKLPKRSAL